MKIFYQGGDVLCPLPTETGLPYKPSRAKVFFRTLLLAFCTCLLLFGLPEARAQSPERQEAVAGGKELIKEVSIGHSVPKDFWTREHLFFINGDTVRKSLSESEGKMLVVDFWSAGCSPCLLHQKSIREYAEKYKDKLSVVMVNSKNTKDSFEKLKSLYEKDFFKKFGIEDIETIILDEYLMSIFPYTSFPHYVWINEIGRLQLRTFRNLLDKDYVAPFVNVQP